MTSSVASADGSSHSESRPLILERAGWLFGIGALWAAGYFALGSATSAHTLATSIDDRIPFVAWSVWAYLAGLVVIVAPAFVLHSNSLLRRTAAAYCVVLLASFACFFAYPVTSVGLRPIAALERVTPLTTWALQTLYAIDPPYNLFPSLHVSLSSIAALSIWRTSRSLGVVAVVAAGLVAISVCTVKQHFVLDVVGGVTLSAVALALTTPPHGSLQRSSHGL